MENECEVNHAIVGRLYIESFECGTRYTGTSKRKNRTFRGQTKNLLEQTIEKYRNVYAFISNR